MFTDWAHCWNHGLTCINMLAIFSPARRLVGTYKKNIWLAHSRGVEMHFRQGLYISSNAASPESRGVEMNCLLSVWLIDPSLLAKEDIRTGHSFWPQALLLPLRRIIMQSL